MPVMKLGFVEFELLEGALPLIPVPGVGQQHAAHIPKNRVNLGQEHSFTISLWSGQSQNANPENQIPKDDTRRRPWRAAGELFLGRSDEVKRPGKLRAASLGHVLGGFISQTSAAGHIGAGPQIVVLPQAVRAEMALVHLAMN